MTENNSGGGSGGGDTMAKEVHYKLAKYVDWIQRYYKYHPQTLLENTKHKLYWDVNDETDETISDKPSILVTEKWEKNYRLQHIFG